MYRSSQQYVSRKCCSTYGMCYNHGAELCSQRRYIKGERSFLVLTKKYRLPTYTSTYICRHVRTKHALCLDIASNFSNSRGSFFAPSAAGHAGGACVLTGQAWATARSPWRVLWASKVARPWLLRNCCPPPRAWHNINSPTIQRFCSAAAASCVSRHGLRYHQDLYLVATSVHQQAHITFFYFCGDYERSSEYVSLSHVFCRPRKYLL